MLRATKYEDEEHILQYFWDLLCNNMAHNMVVQISEV